MLDVSVSYNRYKFLGHEFLTWLWFLVEKDRSSLDQIDPGLTSLDIGNRVVLENRINDAVETITIKGDEAGLEEGLLALRKGAVVTEMNLVLALGENRWRFTLKGESLSFSGLSTPEVGAVETGEDLEGAVLEKTYLLEQAVRFANELFKRFVKLRVSAEWDQATVPKMKAWMLSASPRSGYGSLA